jgi:hypothetical protein
MWQQTSADQVQLTLNAPLAAIDGPTFIRLTAREGELATADDEDHYGQLGRVWLRFDDLALNRNTLPYDSDTATVAVEQGGFTGAYKGALPAAQGHGRDLLLVLNRDRTATLRTDHLNAEPPLLEAGTWTTDSIGRLILTLTGQADQVYDPPIVLQFELLNGVLYAIDEEASRDEARLRLFHMGGLTGGFISQYLSIGP